MTDLEEAKANLNALLTDMVQRKISDIHLRTGTRPAGRLDGSIERLESEPLSDKTMEAYVRVMLGEQGYAKFTELREADFAYGINGVARFRVNAYFQRNNIGLIMRVIEDRAIPTFEDLGLPIDTFQKLAEHERGLILVTGPTGSGKTTTLASLLNYINVNHAVNIVTLEDPIEVVHRDQKAIVNQREVGRDSLSWTNGLRAAMRQDPDIILIGEMRDKETVEAALSAASTGHLVFSTLHTQDAIRSIGRIIDFFAPHERDSIRLSLSEAIVGVISQRLLPRVGGGRVIGMEVMIATPLIREAIKDPERLEDIKEALMEGKQHGMHTFDQHLVELVKRNLISEADALASATSPHEVKIAMMRVKSGLE